MKLIEKIANAKEQIKESKLKKEGRNEFSKYDYFTPQQIELLVQKVCKDNKLLTTFNLIRNDLGVTGELSIYDLDSNEVMTYKMATAIPEIKATNIAQQLGGCVTYTERYLKMSAFGITDSNLDFDSQKPQEKKETEWLTEEQFKKAMASDKKGILATLTAYNGQKGKSMKSEYLTALTKQMGEAK